VMGPHLYCVLLGGPEATESVQHVIDNDAGPSQLQDGAL
jgi:hypothetical protein